MRTAEAHQNWDLLDALSLGAVIIGYLLTVTYPNHLTLAGFTLLTAAIIGWVCAYVNIGKQKVCGASFAMQRNAVFLALCALVGLWTAKLGMGLDWLFPVITVGVIGAILPLRQALLLGFGTCFASCLLFFSLFHQHDTNFSSDLFSFALPFCFAFAFTTLLRRQVQARQEAQDLLLALAESKAALELANTQLQHYAAQIEELTVTRERNRMAREIHDSLGHYLTILAVKLETATKLEEHGDTRLHEELSEARRVASECLVEVRHSVTALRPAGLNEESIAAALRHLARDFEMSCPDVAIVLDSEDTTQTLAPEYRLALFRATQEALTNIRKHAHATKVLIRLRLNEDLVELTILDNGVGAAAPIAATKGFGLLGMRERVALLGGTIAAASEPERGWRVELVIPLARADAHSPPAAPLLAQLVPAIGRPV